MNPKRFWQNNYESGIPGDIDADQVTPLVDYLNRSSQDYPKAIALSNFGCQMRYAELNAASKKFAWALRHDFELAPGDRVAIMLPNIFQFPIALFGVLRAGLVVVNVNPLYTPRELQHQLKDCSAKAIIVLENFASVVQQSISSTKVEHIIVTKLGDCLGAKGMLLNTVVKYLKKAVPQWQIPGAVQYKKLMLAGNAVEFIDHPASLDDIALLQYTGGTTGPSKGAILTHRNISSNIQQGLEWCCQRFIPGEEVAITALPLYHIFALTANLMFMVAVAGNCVLIANPRDLKATVKILKSWSMTYITGVNTLYAALMRTPNIDSIDFSRLKIALGAGMAVTGTVAKDWYQLTGKPMIEVYGLSETSPAVCMNRLDLKIYNGFVGLPMPSTDIKIIDTNGETVDVGQQGELCVKGPQVTPGYWQNPDANGQAYTGDGYFMTGDYAVINEDGLVKILDRKKDMILVAGFNVYPNEIEDTVGEHPDVLEVAAIGVFDEKSGERVKLFVVKKNQNLNEADLIEWCRQNMTGYKVPRVVEFQSSLPKSAVGKILRRELR